MTPRIRLFQFMIALFAPALSLPVAAQAPLYEYSAGSETRWASPENPGAAKPTAAPRGTPSRPSRPAGRTYWPTFAARA